MECYYHPERESTDNCNICGKSVCKECGLEIANKIYCKECLEKIIGLEDENSTSEKREVEPEPLVTEPAEVTAQTTDDTLYQPQDEEIDFEIPYAPQEDIQTKQEFTGISEDSPYNIKENIEYSGGLESSYMDDVYQKPQAEQPQIAQNEFDKPKEQIAAPKAEDDYIYPDHSYEPQPTSARMELEDKYEKYLDDLYFDENEVPLGEQLAKDEAQYGSLTRREYAPRKEAPVEQKVPAQRKAPLKETPEEMEARIRAEILKEQGLMTGKEEDKNIHNLNYQEEKEPMGILDILLTIILVIVILIVIYYLIYLFILSATYPTFTDALFALKNPQNIINHLLSN